jgi:hypothetical protein
MRSSYFTGSLLLAAAFVAAGNVPPARADGKSKAAGELARFVLRKFGAKAVAEGGEALARRIASTAARHGDDVFHAVRRIGPRALSLADDAGKHAPHVLKFVAKHGDDAAAVMTKQSMKLLSLGDDAGRALLRHKSVVVPMLETYGSTAARALATVTPQNGRRLVMLAKTFDRVQQTKKVVEVVAKYGDRAVNWMWANKGALATAAACSAFLADPEAFMSGARKLTDTVAKQVVVPVSSAVIDGSVKIGDSLLRHAVKPVVTEMSRAAARSMPWGTLAAVALAGFAGLASLAAWRLRWLVPAWAVSRPRQPAPVS